jgi:hypothetical protein
MLIAPDLGEAQKFVIVSGNMIAILLSVLYNMYWKLQKNKTLAVFRNKK